MRIFDWSQERNFQQYLCWADHLMWKTIIQREYVCVFNLWSVFLKKVQIPNYDNTYSRNSFPSMGIIEENPYEWKIIIYGLFTHKFKYVCIVMSFIIFLFHTQSIISERKYERERDRSSHLKFIAFKYSFLDLQYVCLHFVKTIWTFVRKEKK